MFMCQLYKNKGPSRAMATTLTETPQFLTHQTNPFAPSNDDNDDDDECDASRELFSVPSIDELYTQTNQATIQQPLMAESMGQPILKPPSQPSQESTVDSQERQAIHSVR